LSNLTQNQINDIYKLADEGYKSRAIGKRVGCSKSTVNNYLSKREGGVSVDLPEIEDKDLEVFCDSSDKHIASLAKRLRTAQKTNTQLRKTINGSVDQTEHFNDMVRGVQSATESLSQKTPLTYEIRREEGVPATAEILFSDFQIGKIGQYYNSDLAHKAISKYGNSIMSELTNSDFSFERIILACLGDSVEDHQKHGVQSATSTDSGLAEQMAKAIEYLWEYVIHPIGSLGIPTEIICIAGNHGSSQHKGMDMFKAGLFSYDYPIYKALEGYCKVKGWEHVKFVIPEGVFAYTEIYGRTAVYEHGYFNTCTEKSLQDQKAKRSRQIKRHVEYFRCGDMHHVCDYNNGQEVVNGAFFGVDNEGIEYSGIIGFDSVPCQKMMIHTKESSLGRNTIKRNINLQVADGY
jgi:predicted transcriptional regulator